MNLKANEDWLERTELLLGSEELNMLKKAHVLIAGVGGVGAYAAEQIVRAGVGEITMIDSDKVQASNINRQLPALHSTIGKSKVRILEERFRDINPEIRIHVIEEYLKDKNLEEIAKKKFDYIVDAIDTLSPKVFFLYFCMQNKQRLVSSMGAGGKTDPSQIHIAPIEDTHTCHLAFLVRKKLHKLGIYEGFKAVFSTEKVSKESMIQTENERNKKTTVGTISYLPPIFGCFCASVVIRDLTKTT